MRSYWVWLGLLIVTWLLAGVFDADIQSPNFMVGSALFFGCYFLSPLLEKKPIYHMLLFIVMGFVSIVVFWPLHTTQLNFFALLVFGLIGGKAAYRLGILQAVGIGVILYLGAVIPYVNAPIEFPLLISLYAILLSIAFSALYQTINHEQKLIERQEALRSEFRKVKRQLVTSEELVRQEERAQIARDMHDSVGHKLTALLMQLEVAQMQTTDPESKERLLLLKDLAQESLADTRSAVKTLKNDEVGGLSAVIQLIRKLEAESNVRITFSVKQGALSSMLTNQQSITVYRAVQEALTNIMRHSKSREASVAFSVPTGRYFRFQISNPVDKTTSFQEGFGLTAMRERIDQISGNLEITQTNEEFRIIGTFPLAKGEQL